VDLTKFEKLMDKSRLSLKLLNSRPMRRMKAFVKTSDLQQQFANAENLRY
jgi:hypothetical protein